MHLIYLLLVVCLQSAISPVSAAQSQATTDELEARLSEIDAELARTSKLTLRSGVGNVGWISEPQKNSTQPEWVEVQLPENTPIDRIVLVPMLWNDAERGPQADGFPTAFKIIAGQKGDTQGTIIASMDSDNRFLPRVAPLIIDLPATTSAWVRVQSIQLPQHAREDGHHRFKLSEFMVFSGERNVALGRPVRTSSIQDGWGAAAIYNEALVDGLTPYLMDAAGEEKSDPYMVARATGVPFSINMDLGRSQSIEAIRIHGADVNEYIPQINPADFGMPTHFIVEGATKSNFAASTRLLEYKLPSIYQAGNILEWRIPDTDCRFIRISIPKNAWPLDAGNEKRYISLAEIEVISEGRNVAKNKAVTTYPRKRIREANRSSLTDGLNHFGRILPIREWMEQLARRHDLQIERPIVAAELNQKYARQKANLIRMSWIAGLLAVAIAFVLLIARLVQMRAVLKMRERIAANLHDELSANLHALALLGDMAQKHIQTPDKLTTVIDRIQDLSNRSRNAARLCTNMLQANTIGEDLPTEIRYTADRLLANIEHKLDVEGEPFLQRLPKRKRNDLFLFYKECLTNIARHAEASACRSHLSGSKREIKLVVEDNGLGIKKTPASLQRRARLLRANLTTETPETGGTRIILIL
ncbi:MAG: hypothetical protein ACSHYA_07300 [Opitutaceae bacterium]